MAIDITKLSEEELSQDREASLDDIAICQMALAVGIYEYSGGSVQQRLDVNRKIVQKIDTELERRKAAQHGM